MSKIHPDSMQMANWVVNGALAGGTTAALATLIRWIRLNRKLKKFDQPVVKGDEHTLAITLPGSSTGSIDKAASNTSLELGGAALASGAASYALLTWLANKIEGNRMRKKEEQARQEVLARLVPHEKSAGILDGISDLYRSQTLYRIAAFLAAAAITKKHLDRKARNSDSIKVVRPDNAVFVPAEGAQDRE